MWADPNVTRFIGGRASTPQQTWLRMLAYAGHWKLMHFGYWAIEERVSGAFVGEVGFADFKRDVAPSLEDAPELGIALARRFHGRGYGMESVRAVLEWADAHLSCRRTVCLVHPGNAASLRIFERCGYVAYDRGEYDGRPVLFLSREASPAT